MRLVDPSAAAVLRQLRSDQRPYAARLDIDAGDGDQSTRNTIAAMRAIVHHAARSPKVHQVASVLAARTAPKDVAAQLAGLDGFIRECVQFKPDTMGLEVLRHPDQLLSEIAANGRTSCDCDDVAMLGASVCRVLGVKPAFITVGHEPEGAYVHVHYAALADFPAPTLVPFDPQEHIPPGVWTPAGRRAGWWA